MHTNAISISMAVPASSTTGKIPFSVPVGFQAILATSKHNTTFEGELDATEEQQPSERRNKTPDDKSRTTAVAQSNLDPPSTSPPATAAPGPQAFSDAATAPSVPALVDASRISTAIIRTRMTSGAPASSIPPPLAVSPANVSGTIVDPAADVTANPAANSAANLGFAPAPAPTPAKEAHDFAGTRDATAKVAPQGAPSVATVASRQIGRVVAPPLSSSDASFVPDPALAPSFAAVPDSPALDLPAPILATAQIAVRDTSNVSSPTDSTPAFNLAEIEPPTSVAASDSPLLQSPVAQSPDTRGTSFMAPLMTALITSLPTLPMVATSAGGMNPQIELNPSSNTNNGTIPALTTVSLADDASEIIFALPDASTPAPVPSIVPVPTASEEFRPSQPFPWNSGFIVQSGPVIEKQSASRQASTLEKLTLDQSNLEKDVSGVGVSFSVDGIETGLGTGLRTDTTSVSSLPHAPSATPAPSAALQVPDNPRFNSDSNAIPLSNIASTDIADQSTPTVATDNPWTRATSPSTDAISALSPLVSITAPTPIATGSASNASGVQSSGQSPAKAVPASTALDNDKKSGNSIVANVPQSGGIAASALQSPITPTVSTTSANPDLNLNLNPQGQNSPPVPAPPSQDPSTVEIPKPHQVLDAAPPAPAVPAPPIDIRSDVQTNAQMHVGIRTDAFGSVEIHTVVQQSQVGITVHADHDLARWFGPEVSSLEAGLNQHHFDLTAVDFNSGRSSAHSESGSQEGQGKRQEHGRELELGSEQQPEQQQRQSHPGSSQSQSPSAHASSSDTHNRGFEEELPAISTQHLSSDPSTRFAHNRVSIHA